MSCPKYRAFSKIYCQNHAPFNPCYFKGDFIIEHKKQNTKRFYKILQYILNFFKKYIAPIFLQKIAYLLRQTTEKFNEKVKEDQLILEQKKREEVLEERKEKLVKDMTDEEFDDMLQQLMEERLGRKRKKQSDMEM